MHDYGPPQNTGTLYNTPVKAYVVWTPWNSSVFSFTAIKTNSYPNTLEIATLYSTLSVTFNWNMSSHDVEQSSNSSVYTASVSCCLPKYKFFKNCIWNQQSDYKVFYKQMGWLWVKLLDVLAWWGPLLRGELVHRITGQLATVVSVFVRRYLVGWGGVGGSSEFLI